MNPEMIDMTELSGNMIKRSLFRIFPMLSMLILVSAVAANGQFMEPVLVTSSTNVSPGQQIFLTGRYYTPGAYSGQILFNGTFVDAYYIPEGGDFSTTFVIPPSASPGDHLIEICAGNPCHPGEFEQRAGVTVTVSGSVSPSDIDYQAQAYEVTQGVRGDIVSRQAPHGDLVLPSETAVHISGRRTIVRVFPWVGGSGTVRQITARLSGSRDGIPLPGSPLSPVNGRLRPPSSSTTLDEMRADPEQTWNFVLPESWTTLGGEPGDFKIDLAVQVNPAGVDRWPECEGCFENNTMHIGFIDFVSMTRDEPRRIITSLPGVRTAPLIIRPFLIDFDDPIELVNHPPPTRSDLSAVIGAIHRMFPLPDGHRGMAVLPPRVVAFADTINGVDGRWYFFEEMESRFFRGGSYSEHEEGDVYLFLFSQGCGGQARISFAQSGACVAGLDFGPFVPVHEVGHALGRGHAGNGHNEENGGGFDAAYPGDHGQVEANTWGYDVWRNRVYPPDPSLTPLTEWIADTFDNDEGVTHDLMSYGPLPAWVSQYTWAGITSFLGEPTVSPALMPMIASASMASSGGSMQAQANETYLRFAGFVSPEGEAFLRPVFEVATEKTSAIDPQLPSGYSLRFRDANGVELALVALQNNVPQDVLNFSAVLFSELIEAPGEWADLQVLDPNGVVLEERTRSPNVPFVELLLPSPNENWGAQGDVEVAWKASDADGDMLTFRVEGSPDQGVTWYPLTGEIEDATSALVRTENIPGSDFWMVRVQASDGLNVGFSEARGVLLAPKPPAPLILNPYDGSTFMAGEPVPLHGVASDWQDGVINGGDFFWEVDGEFAAEGTATPTLNGLSEGEHEITLRVYNSFGLEGKATSVVQVESRGDAPEMPSSLSLVSDQELGVELMWNEVADAVTYSVQIATDNNFQQIVEDVVGVVAPMFFPGTLESGELYYWRVRAVNEHGAGPWSPVGVVVADAPPITPHPDVEQAAILDLVTLDIVVGDENRHVGDLFGVGFKLHFDPSRLTIAPGDIEAGPFLSGTDLITIDPVIDAENGLVSFSVTRKEDAEGVSGVGTVATMTFTVRSDAPTGTAVFTFSDVLAVSPDAQVIPLVIEQRSVEIVSVVVWPGDTNNDGIVKIDDLLPIGFYFDETGPPRPGADLRWRGQPAIPWVDLEATYADATGDGLVSQNDVLPIGLHFGKEREEAAASVVAKAGSVSLPDRLAVLHFPPLEAGTAVNVDLLIGDLDGPVDGLLGVAAELILPAGMQLVSARPGDLIDDGDLLSLQHFDKNERLLSLAYARKGREHQVAGSGRLFELDLEIQEATDGVELVLREMVLSMTDGRLVVEAEGPPSLRLESPQATSIETSETEVVTDYALEQNYPNPFNPSTQISFALPETGHISLVVFDMLGRAVATLVDAPLAAGRHTVRFDASGLPGGVYLYRLRTDGYTSSKRLVLVK